MPVPIRATYDPKAALPDANPGLFAEIVEDFRGLLKARADTKVTRMVTTVEELSDKLNGSVTALDLEWDSQGRIRMIGVSDGRTNVVALDPNVVMEWLKDRST